MPVRIDDLLQTLRQTYPTSLVKKLDEPAMFLRSNLGRSYTAEGMQITSVDAALEYAKGYMHSLIERTQATEGFALNQDHPWIIGVFPGSPTAAPLIFIFGNIVRYGKEVWLEVGEPRYEPLAF
jgi:hypothetical protein